MILVTLLNQIFQISLRSLQVRLRIVHPFQSESGGKKIQAGQTFHPLCLLGTGNFAQAYQRDPYAVAQ